MQDYERLKALLAEMGEVVVAYSGGTDSTLVAKAATEVLGDRALCVIVESSLMARREIEEAVERAQQLGFALLEVQMDPIDEKVAANPPDRCYHCKKQVFQQLLDVARERGIDCVVDGSNADDDSDYRPGRKALAELGIRSPLKELGIGKQKIRDISRKLGLPTWKKPAWACLASRVPYGTRLSEELLCRIESAEAVLHDFGFTQYRVRHHGDVARIEVMPEDMPKTVSAPVRERIVSELKKLGYTYVALDLVGYKTGSMNEPLSQL